MYWIMTVSNSKQKKWNNNNNRVSCCGIQQINMYMILVLFLFNTFRDCVGRTVLQEIPVQDVSEATCVNGTLWDAVLSVENATVWQRAMNATGLRLVLDSPESRGDAVFVVRDGDLLNCEDRSVAECRQVELQWQLQLGSPAAVGLLLLHWIPGYGDAIAAVSSNGSSSVAVTSKLKEAVEKNATLSEQQQVWNLELVLSDVGDLNTSGLVVVSNSNNDSSSNTNAAAVGELRLVDGQEARGGRLGGVRGAQVTDVVEVCDGGGTVYVLDGVVFPDLLPETNVTELPLLDGRCWENFMTLAQRTGANFPYVLLATFANPIVSEVLDPASNITLFVPSFEGSLDPSILFGMISILYNGPVDVPRIEKKKRLSIKMNRVFLSVVLETTSKPEEIGETAVLLLSHIFRGGYCPSELDGQSLQTLAGELAGQDFRVQFAADPSDPNTVCFNYLFLSCVEEYVCTICVSRKNRNNRSIYN